MSSKTVRIVKTPPSHHSHNPKTLDTYATRLETTSIHLSMLKTRHLTKMSTTHTIRPRKSRLGQTRKSPTTTKWQSILGSWNRSKLNLPPNTNSIQMPTFIRGCRIM